MEEHLENAGQLEPSLFHVSACGTAFYAGMVVRDYIEGINRVPCALELGSEFRYRNPILSKSDVGLFISQSEKQPIPWLLKKNVKLTA